MVRLLPIGVDTISSAQQLANLDHRFDSAKSQHLTADDLPDNIALN